MLPKQNIFKKVADFYNDSEYFSQILHIALPIATQQLVTSSLNMASVVSVKQGSPIRGTVRDDFSDRTYQQTITGYVYYIDVK